MLPDKTEREMDFRIDKLYTHGVENIVESFLLYIHK